MKANIYKLCKGVATLVITLTALLILAPQKTTHAYSYYGFDFSPIFDATNYLNRYPDLKQLYGNNADAAFSHFINTGMSEGRQGCNSFDPKAYRQNNPDIANALGSNYVDYYIHYLGGGKAEGRIGIDSNSTFYSNKANDATNYSTVFDEFYYSNRYSDVRKACGSNIGAVFEHFMNYGIKEGRQACYDFDPVYYKNTYSSLRNAYGNNWQAYYNHYANYGKKEGRQGHSTDESSVTFKSKKGVQGTEWLTDNPDLNVNYTLVNIHLDQWFSDVETNESYEYNGKTYYFNTGMNGIDNFVNQMTERDTKVVFVLLMAWNDHYQDLIYPGGRQKENHLFYALNTVDSSAKNRISALFCYLAERYPDVKDWIIGNEVNMPDAYNYTGTTDKNTNVTVCADSFLMLYNALQQENPDAKAYISIDHCWDYDNNGTGIPGKDFLLAFDSTLKAKQSNVKWNLSYHLYAPIITFSRMWSPEYARYSPNSEDAMYITPVNLNVLTDFVKEHFGKDCRITLSEQGFVNTESDQLQAAATVYAFYAAQFNDMVDSFIYYSYQDSDASFLKLGLKNSNGSKKEVYDVFCNMDQPGSSGYTNKYLPVIGISSWNEVILNYTSKINWVQKYSSGETGSADANGDNKVDLTDAKLTLEVALGIPSTTLSNPLSVDVDNDGKVSLADAQKILKVALGIESL